MKKIEDNYSHFKSIKLQILSEDSYFQNHSTNFMKRSMIDSQQAITDTVLCLKPSNYSSYLRNTETENLELDQLMYTFPYLLSLKPTMHDAVKFWKQIFPRVLWEWQHTSTGTLGNVQWIFPRWLFSMQNISQGDRAFMLSVSEHPWKCSGF